MDPLNESPKSKVNQSEASEGAMDQLYLAQGKAVGLRMWKDEPPTEGQQMHSRAYETVGYVIAGAVTLHVEGKDAKDLAAGDSWVVPAGVSHRYHIRQTLTAIEATSPPARVHGRDTPPS